MKIAFAGKEIYANKNNGKLELVVYSPMKLYTRGEVFTNDDMSMHA